jgi:hypothetical protein
MTELVETKYEGGPGRPAPEWVVERGLMALAIHNGNSRRARDFLAKDGIKIAYQTLQAWARQRYPDRYQALREDILPKVRAKAADEHMDLAERLMRTNRKLLDRLHENVDEIKPGELAGAVRNMSVSAAVETEKAQLLNDQPTSRVATNMPGLLKELKGMGVEVIDAELVGEEDVTPSSND